jgi:pantetheine-phosphate adenylyltransferase
MNIQPAPRVVVYTGTFDPITLGHLNVIQRGASLFDSLIVGVGINTKKEPMFTADERVDLVRRVCRPLSNVEIRTFSGLAVEFVRQCRAHVMIRGVRPLTDIAAEFTMMLANKQLDPSIDTIFLMANEEYSHVSSSLIKEIAPLATDEMLARFLPKEIIPDLRQRLKSPSTQRP